MMNKLTASAVAVLLVGWLTAGHAEAQNFTLTITTTGLNAGAVGVIPLGVPCNLQGGGTCLYSVPSGLSIQM